MRIRVNPRPLFISSGKTDRDPVCCRECSAHGDGGWFHRKCGIAEPDNADLHTQFHIVQWAVLSFLMGLTVLMLVAGRLGDMVEKKRVFTIGLIVFVLFSALCELSPGIYWLIVFRFLQAVGATMIVSLGVAIITETWPVAERGTAIGISAGIISLGAAAGPALGGFILHALSWRWIFFVNIPIGLLSLVPLALVVSGPISGMLADRMGTRSISLIGLAVILVSYIAMTRITVFTTPAHFILLTLPNGLGMAIFQSPNNTAIMGAAPRHRLGVANGMLRMTRTLGQLTGVSLLGAFFSCRMQAYAGKVVDGTAASSGTIVRALHDQFHLAAALPRRSGLEVVA